MRDDLSTAERTGRRLEGRHVLWSFLAFFAVVFAVNGYFMFTALSTHTGVVAVEPYRKGLAYNERIAADERQHALGWTDALKVTADGKVSVVLTDRDGAPVVYASVSGTLGRPATAREDQLLQFAESGGGSYKAVVDALEEGTWIVALEVRNNPADPDPVYRSRRRVWLKP